MIKTTELLEEALLIEKAETLTGCANEIEIMEMTAGHYNNALNFMIAIRKRVNPTELLKKELENVSQENCMCGHAIHSILFAMSNANIKK